MFASGRPRRPRHWICAVAAAFVWLSVTAAAAARAGEPQSRSGVTLRGGSIAGFTQLAGERVPTVGVQLGFGVQLGPLALELEHERGVLLEENNGQARGDIHRSALELRLYVLSLHRFASRSMLRVYLEAGGGRTGGELSTGDGFSRHDAGIGGGLLLDHRALSGGGLRFAGWYLGWSFRGSPAADMSPSFAARCQASAASGCPSPPPPKSPVDLGLIVSSAVTFSW